MRARASSLTWRSMPSRTQTTMTSLVAPSSRTRQRACRSSWMCVDGNGAKPPTMALPRGGVMLLVAAPALKGFASWAGSAEVQQTVIKHAKTSERRTISFPVFGSHTRRTPGVEDERQPRSIEGGLERLGAVLQLVAMLRRGQGDDPEKVDRFAVEHQRLRQAIVRLQERKQEEECDEVGARKDRFGRVAVGDRMAPGEPGVEVEDEARRSGQKRDELAAGRLRSRQVEDDLGTPGELRRRVWGGLHADVAHAAGHERVEVAPEIARL